MDTSVVSIFSFDRSSCCEPCVVLVYQSWWLSKFVLCFVAQSCLILCDLVDCSPPGTSVHGDSPGNNTGVDCHALLQLYRDYICTIHSLELNKLECVSLCKKKLFGLTTKELIRSRLAYWLLSIISKQLINWEFVEHKLPSYYTHW